jgi:hypothetical protein
MNERAVRETSGAAENKSLEIKPERGLGRDPLRPVSGVPRPRRVPSA